MWTQEQEAFLGLPSQHPRQQTLHHGIIGTDDRVHQQQHHHHNRSTTMDLPGPSNPRASRNMAEKQRRDNLNAHIKSMEALVPIISGSSRRMDKISILRLTAAFLRTQYALGPGKKDFVSKKYCDFDLEEYFIANLIGNEGFFIVLTNMGKIVYVSRQVKEHFGYAQDELIGSFLYDFIHPDDHEELRRNLTFDDMQPAMHLPGVQITEATNDNSNSSDDSMSPRNERISFPEQRRSFQIRMSERTGSKRDHTQYETIDISGVFKLADACKNQRVNASRTRHREIPSTSNDIIFVGMVRLPKKRPITELSILDANKDEYVTRHLVDGRIIYCDHRVSAVAGYMTTEVSGRSAFSFMHKDDSRWTMIGLRQMYDRAETCGSSCYRLVSKTGEFIYLRTHGCLEYDKDTQTVVSFVCINTLVSEEEGIKLVKEMKERFSATVSEATRAMIQNGDGISFDLGLDSPRPNSTNSLEEPSQLEHAVTNLISDLQSCPIPKERSPLPADTQFLKAARVAQSFPPAAAQASEIGIQLEFPKQERTLLNRNGESPKLVSPVPIAPSATQMDVVTMNGASFNNHTTTSRDPDASHLEVPETIRPSVENNMCEVSVVSPKSVDSNRPYKQKRLSSDEDMQAVCAKKRHSDILYAPTNTEDDCRPFVNEDDTLLGLGLHASPETVNEATIEQFMIANQAVSDKIRSTHIQFANKMQLCDSDFDEIARGLKNSATSFSEELQKLTEYQAEHEEEKQIFKTLQQDHQNWQSNVKYNIGV